MHLSDFNFHTMAMRHLIAVYASILVVQAGYFLWVAHQWTRLSAQKATKPL